MGQTLSTMTVASPSGPGSAQNVLNRLFFASGPLRSATSSTLTRASTRSSTVPPAAVLTATTNNRRPRPSNPRLSYSSFFPFSSPHLPLSMSMASSSPHSTASSEIATPRSRSSTTSSPRRLTDSNPMSPVDLTKIEQEIKMAALDQHRGYVQDHYAEVKQDRTPEYVDESNAAGYQIVREPLWNKGKPSHSTLSIATTLVVTTMAPVALLPLVVMEGVRRSSRIPSSPAIILSLEAC
ncbi:hypothetical protein IWW34DRAFT_93898 [Fusarium oxysporum f. sp. albedinis]|nr:hypothetical protein IWW34DRAFT_93898 [Fusarium oxysporum f. sp. albedinis]